MKAFAKINDTNERLRELYGMTALTDHIILTLLDKNYRNNHSL